LKSEIEVEVGEREEKEENVPLEPLTSKQIIHYFDNVL
jgi:hypothetical protein